MSIRLMIGDCRDVLKTLPDCSVQTCVTSPPYWGLRDYGVDGQLGLEKTPDEYVARIVDVFRQVRRVLRDDGTLWLNLGDSYAGNGTNRNGLGNSVIGSGPNGACKQRDIAGQSKSSVPPGLKSKDLVGIPWRVAFALQADGWYLRSDIIWHKPNPMPESVTDRPTKAHEYLFLFAKGQWVTRVVQFSNLSRERVHLGKYLGLDRPGFGPNEVCVLLATEVFNRAQREQSFGLPPFYSQEWKQGMDGGDSDFVRGLPPNHIAAVWAARFLDGDATSEQFLCEMDRLRIALRDSDDLLISGIAPKTPNAPSLYCDREGTVTVHHSGKISKIEFIHKRIVVSTPTTCNYYYDADAVTEPAISPQSKGKRSGSYMELSGRNDGANQSSGGFVRPDPAHRNRRSVWTVATLPFSGAHFATFPPKLIEPCVLAGSRKGDTVLDPFGGAGTTGLVADRLGRDAIVIELNKAYVALGSDRIVDDAPLFVNLETVDGS